MAVLSRECYQFDERKQASIVQKFGLRRLQRLDATQAEPPFLLLSKEKDKRRLCSQDVDLPTITPNAKNISGK